MKQLSSWLYVSSMLLVSLTTSNAQETPWHAVAMNELSTDEERRIIPDKFQAFLLDTAALKHQLRSSPHEEDVNPAQSERIIQLPDPEGGWQSFRIVAYDLLHPDLQQDWWYIRTWRGVSTINPAISIRIDWTARGFHAMIMERGNTWFIDPYFWNQQDYYQVYYKKHYPRPSEHFECTVTDEPGDDLQESGLVRAGDCQFRTYRLALACTGEYAAFHGGTTAGAASAMATSLNRVNGVYEADLAIRLVLVANNNNLIFLDGSNDPYSNGNGSAMLGQNQTTCDNVIGTANYDIGHVYSTGGGGIASLRSPCSSTRKARGVTGQSNPVGDPFDIDYVAHEMGHQFGGNHTQNNNCNRSSASAEPGSASTIMGYAGICSPNVQSNSDAYYHGINIQEIANYMETGGGNSCATILDMSNNGPSIAAGQDYDIPGGTPFVLTGNATDPDGDPLSYCWEQYDTEVGENMPPQASNTQGPMFRSFDPTPAAARYFPRLTDLVNNVDPTWETLPETDRDMDFRVTVRDFDGNYGCTTEDNIMLTVEASAGPFLVTNPNTNLTWNEGASASVEWDVAGTTASPISCGNVDILLSYDGGLTYPVTLLSNTANDGSQTVTVPTGTSTTARVMVRCADNVFFDISNTNFTIDNGAVPDYTFSYAGGTPSDCAGINASLDFIVNSTAVNGYNDPLNLSVISAPVGVNVVFSMNPINPGDNVTVTVSNFTSLSAGNYMVTVQSASTSGNKTVDLPFTLIDPSGPPALLEPMDFAGDESILPYFDWDVVATATSYLLEVAEDAAFTSIVFSSTTTATALTPSSPLNSNSPYYWRVSSIDICGTGSPSAARLFKTGPCYYYDNNNSVPISSGAPADYTSIINIGDGGTIEDVDLVNLDMTHSRVGDLQVQIEAPSTTVRTMFSYICGSNDDVLLSFSDEASSAISCPLNTGNKVQPNETLSNFDGGNMTGAWTLHFRDNVSGSGGSLNGWGLVVCASNFTPLPVEWLHFEAKAKENSIDLSWETAKETDNLGFELERRSAYEEQFRPIVWLDATEHPGPINRYYYEDRDVRPGLTYFYRIRQLDYSGQEDYSEIRSAKLVSTQPQWTVYPNPASGSVRLRFWNTADDVDLQVVDTQGRVLQQVQLAPQQLHNLPLDQLPTGIYWLRAKTTDWEQTERILVY